jgi:hypothetical protein
MSGEVFGRDLMLALPGELYTTGIEFSLAQARRRRLNRPAMRIR